MAEDEEPTGPSLEPPSLFRRRKKDAAAPPADDTPTTILDDVGPVAASPGPQPTAPPLFADEAPAAPPASSDADPLFSTPENHGNVSLDAPAAPKAPKVRRPGPLVPGPVAAAIAGLLVAAVIVGLTKASFSLCERWQGTDSCGGPGFFLLLAILVLAVVVGSLVLRLCKVGEPGSTSFLAVGLTSVIALLFLVDQLFDWWMVIAIPLVSVATFLMSHWVTSTFVDTEPEVRLVAEPEVADHDVR
jgi:hypothetical protein